MLAVQCAGVVWDYRSGDMAGARHRKTHLCGAVDARDRTATAACVTGRSSARLLTRGLRKRTFDYARVAVH